MPEVPAHDWFLVFDALVYPKRASVTNDTLVFDFMNLVRDAAALRLEVVALTQVAEEVAGRSLLHVIIEQA